MEWVGGSKMKSEWFKVEKEITWGRSEEMDIGKSQAMRKEKNENVWSPVHGLRNISHDSVMGFHFVR